MKSEKLLNKIIAKLEAARQKHVPGAALAGVLIGKLLALAERKGLNWRSVVVANLPTSITVAKRTWGLSSREEQAIEYARAHAGRAVTDLTERAKAGLAATIAQAIEENASPEEAARRLQESYGELNRDWRRTALTETATAVANGYLAAQEPGAWVTGDSSVDCCEWCAEFIQGKVYRLLDTPPAEVTPEISAACVWVGKDNVGRSRYPLKADGTPRKPQELWHPCIPAHPHCRCRWILTTKPGENRE
jgi:hypothetical protein